MNRQSRTNIPISDDFTGDFADRWQVTRSGHARVQRTPRALTLTVNPAPLAVYSNAQITDYDYQTFRFRWSPPLRLILRARATAAAGQLRGTAGFGFWNHPFSRDVTVRLRLPQAAWFFFASPPGDMRLALDVPGSGWKAATIDTRRWPFLALLPTAPIGFLLMRIPALYRRLWPIGQRAIGVSERLLDSALLADWHTYTLDWRPDGMTFAVDGSIVHMASHAPCGSLGFIAWIDNQYAVVTPQGRFRFGLVPVEREQALLLESVQITPGLGGERP